MMKQLFSRALVQPSLNLKVIDAALFPGLAADDAIQSVPTLILDNSFRWTGVVDMNEVRNAIRLRDPAKLGVDSLKSMIVNGDAFQLADMMIRAEKIFVSFVDLLVHEEFSTRLGAMAAAEELVEQRPDIARQLVDPLLNRFEDRIDQIKGDVLYIIGQAGDRRIIPFLNRILSGPYSVEVKEAAQEAVENLSAKT
jgi:predicted thioredoxin/glutaredoxin